MPSLEVLGVQRAFCRRQRSHAGLSSMGGSTLVMEHRTTQATLELYLTRGVPPRRWRAMITLKREDAVTQNVSCAGGEWRTRRGRVEAWVCGLLVHMAQRQDCSSAPIRCELPTQLGAGTKPGGCQGCSSTGHQLVTKGRKQCHDAATTQLGRRIGRVLRRMSGGNCRSPLHTHSRVMPNLLRPPSLPCHSLLS